jgi:hypothetical protein
MQTMKNNKKANYQQVIIIDENNTQYVLLTITNEKYDVSHRPQKNMLLFIMIFLPARLSFRSTLLFFFFYTVNFKMIIWCCGFCCRRHHRQFYFYHRTSIRSKKCAFQPSFLFFFLNTKIGAQILLGSLLSSEAPGPSKKRS